MAAALTSARIQVARFFEWWTGELLGCLPGGLREALERSRERLTLEVAAHKVTFERSHGRELQHLGEINILQADLSGQRNTGQRRAVEEILERADIRSGEVVLRLPRENLLRRSVDLPAQAAENLREVVGFELDRHTPFKGDEVYFDYRVEGTDAKLNRLKIDLVVVPRPVVDQAVKLLQSWGLTPDKITVTDESKNGESSFDLLPDLRVRGGGSPRRWFTGGLAVVVCVLLVAAIYVPLERKEAGLAETREELEIVRAQAMVVDELRKRVEKMVKRGTFVVDRKRSTPTATELLQEVTRILPDNTWVLKFAWRNDKLILSGYSSKPSSLIGLLEESALLSEVRFTSPVTLDQKVGLERFNISAAIIAGGQT
jgi:general secretion pathway protein L